MAFGITDNMARAGAALVALALGTAPIAAAQTSVATTTGTHAFRVLKDDPEAISRRIVGATLAHGHFSSPEGLKASLGADVLWALPFLPGLEAQGNFYWSYLGINSAGGFNYDLEAGAAYPLYRTLKNRELKIILKYKETTDRGAATITKTTEMKFIPSTANYLVQGKARAGLISKRAGYQTSGDDAGKEVSGFNSMGVYAGGEITSQVAQFTEIDGRKGVTSGLTRVYVDGLFLPVGSYEDDQGEGPDPALFGFRAGVAAYLNPSARNHPEYGRLDFLNMFPTLFMKAEAGLRTGEGWFFNMGAGLMVLRL